MNLAIGDVSLVVERHRGEDPEYVVITEDQRHFAVPESVYSVLRTYHESADEGGPLPATVAGIIERLTTRSRRDRRLLANGFWFRVPLVSSNLADRLAAIGKAFFAPFVWPLVLAATLAAAAAAVWIDRTQPLRSLGAIPDIAAAYALAFCSYAVHELGHASALKFSGVKPGRIGFAIYLIFPAFYSNVTGAWGISKWRRALVDVAGSFFEASFIVVFAAGLAATHYQFFWYATLIIGWSVFSNANPVFRFDGYWLIRDLFGTGNVFAIPGRMKVKYAVDLRRRIAAQAVSLALCAIWLSYAALIAYQLVTWIAARLPHLH